MNMMLDESDVSNDLARATEIAIFQCPSDYMNQLPSGWAGTNYRANNGVNVLNSYDSTGPNAGLAPPNGGFFTDSKYKVADIRDGLSNTAAFSEHIKGDFSNSVS